VGLSTKRLKTAKKLADQGFKQLSLLAVIFLERHLVSDSLVPYIHRKLEILTVLKDVG